MSTAELYSTYLYDLNFTNCSDFALTAMSTAGFSTNVDGPDTPNTVTGVIGGTPVVLMLLKPKEHVHNIMKALKFLSALCFLLIIGLHENTTWILMFLILSIYFFIQKFVYFLFNVRMEIFLFRN
ncbi:hypothetical protein [Chryseobacterium sp. RLHN22]|uniref:hypothetical protein n=1 Tax=Chryseobacterium sp. RLHN22 TaxID=3437885 RepID=UPI003D9BD28E